MDDGGVFHIKPLPEHCGLCFGPLGDGKGHLVGGLHLCFDCDGGNLAERLAFRGFRFGEKVEHIPMSNQRMGNQLSLPPRASEFGLVSFVASQVNLSRPVPLKAKFFPEREGGGLLSLFRRELQVGDDLFDKTIYIESKRDEVTAKLLANPGLQSAIMETVFETGKLVVDGAIVRTQIRSTDLEERIDPNIIRRDLAVVAHYLDFFTQHLERPDEVDWPEHDTA